MTSISKPSPTIIKNIAYLILLTETSSSAQKKKLIITATSSQLLAICEIVKNVLYGVLKLKPTYKRELATYETIFQKIINKKFTPNYKRKLILKHFTPFMKLISPIVLLKCKVSENGG